MAINSVQHRYLCNNAELYHTRFHDDWTFLHIKTPPSLHLSITDRSKAVLLLWFSFTCFGVSFGDGSPYVCTNYFYFGLGGFVTIFWENLPSRLTVCSLFFVCLFGLRLYVPVNNFSVMSGRSHRFLGITSTFWEVNVSCSGGKCILLGR